MSEAAKIAMVKEYWRHSDEGLRDEFARMQKGFAFYVGDQWDAADLEKLYVEKRPALTINLILPIINLICGIQRQGRQDITVVARKGGLKKLASGGCEINCVNGHRYVNLIWKKDLLWPTRKKIASDRNN